MSGEPLLAVDNLRVQFPGAPLPVRAVDGVSLRIRAGETLALVGESGCGKSTLARALLGLEPSASGSVRFDGAELLGLSPRALRAHRRGMQMVFQDPSASLNPRMTAAAALAEALRLHARLARTEVDARVCALMERVGLDPALRHRHPHEFSGGQRQRICIARALAVGPRLIVCDEAVSALDVSIQAQILNLLQDLRDAHGLSYLFISHDLAVVRHVADRVAVMYVGQIVEEGSAAAIFAAPRHPYTRALLDAVPTPDPRQPRQKAPVRGDVPSPARPPPGCRFHPRCPVVFSRCAREAPPLLRLGEEGASRCFLSEPSGANGPEGAP